MWAEGAETPVSIQDIHQSHLNSKPGSYLLLTITKMCACTIKNANAPDVHRTTFLVFLNTCSNWSG